MSERILVLAELGSVTLPVIRTLGGRGARAHVAGAGDGAFVRLSRHCASFTRLAADARELAEAGPAVLDAAEAAVRRLAPDLILPADVPGALLAAKLKARLPGARFFPSPDPEALRVLDDKWEFHRLLVAQGLPSPDTRLLAGAAAAAPPLPAVIKPLSESGSQGVAVVRTPAELAARLQGAAYPLLAQAFVDGEDVDLSFLADRGRLLAWAVQMRDADGTIVYLEDERVVEIGRRVAAATGYTGMAHIDMRYDGAARARVVVIECNPRFWATFAGTLGLGVDFMGLGLEMARGAAPEPITKSPVGTSPGLKTALRGLLRGEAGSAGSFASLRQRLLDPGPELRRALRRRLGLDGRGQ